MARFGIGNEPTEISCDSTVEVEVEVEVKVEAEVEVGEVEVGWR